jgi:hypothetical protein
MYIFLNTPQEAVVLKISQNPLRGFGRSRRKGGGVGGGGRG